jgi:hypothetical protein
MHPDGRGGGAGFGVQGGIEPAVELARGDHIALLQQGARRRGGLNTSQGRGWPNTMSERVMRLIAMVACPAGGAYNLASRSSATASV